MAKEYIKGLNVVLEIKGSDLDDFAPIGCLTDNGFSESVENLETTTRDNTNGWATSIPTTQSYSISFTGILVKDNSILTEPTLYVSHNKMLDLKRGRIRIEWRIRMNQIEQTGYGYITQISSATPLDSYVTFDGSIIGYGNITKIQQPEPSGGYIFQDDENFIFQDGENYIFNDL